MNKIHTLKLILTFGLTICLNSKVIAGTHQTNQEQMHAWAIAVNQKFLHWMNSPWQDDDRPYAHIRNEIDALIQQGNKPLDLMKTYEAEAKKSPADAMAEFRYYYAAYKLTSPNENQAEDQAADYRLGKMFILIIKNALPHTYNYARLAFICIIFGNPRETELKNTGIKLLKNDPSDLPVKYALTSLLINSRNPADNATAMKYSLELARQDPTSARAQGMLGGAYYAIWERTRRQADANNAIAAYQKYLALAPANAYFVSTAKVMIEKIQANQ